MPHPTTGPLVLDGGLATELAARGYDLSDALWSARLLADAPEAIEAVHRAYFEVGANVAITTSYQASFEG
jgi:homocysteine S-methyltransferase